MGRTFFPCQQRKKLHRQYAAANAAAADAACSSVPPAAAALVATIAALATTLAAADATQKIGLTCGKEDRSILSVLRNGWDSIVETYTHALLRFFTTKEARVLRTVCSEFTDAVAITPWHDMTSRIGSPSAYRLTSVTDRLERWRQCFPAAIGAKVKDTSHLCTTDFEFFAGLQSLDISLCWGYEPVEAFDYFRGTIRSLKLVQDWFELDYTVKFTDAALMHMPLLEELDLNDCRGFTMALFPHLRGLRKLRIGRLADQSLVYFRGIEELRLDTCRGITAAGLHHLRGIRALHIGECAYFGMRCDVCAFAFEWTYHWN